MWICVSKGGGGERDHEGRRGGGRRLGPPPCQTVMLEEQPHWLPLRVLQIWKYEEGG